MWIQLMVYYGCFLIINATCLLQAMYFEAFCLPGSSKTPLRSLTHAPLMSMMGGSISEQYSSAV